MIQQHFQAVIFGDDDETPILGSVDASGNIVVPTCSTDPTAARPYLKPIMNGVDSSVDFITGSSKIGQVNIEIIDVRTDPEDQASGWFTAILAVNGESRLVGRRVRVEQRGTSGTFGYMFDGVIADVMLDSNMVKYTIVIRDMRERERKKRIFTSAESTCIVPAGLASGYGLLPNGQYIIKPGRGYFGKFIPDPVQSKAGIIAFFDPYILPREDALKIVKYCLAQPSYDEHGTYTGHKFSNVTVRWRPYGSTGAWNTMPVMPYFDNARYRVQSCIAGGERLLIRDLINKTFSFVKLFISADSAGWLPTPYSDVEFQILSNTFPTNEVPLFYEGTYGELLKKIYDGDFSITNPRVRYNPTVMADLVANTPKARMVITGSEDDMRTWLEENWYAPLGMVPALDEHGRVNPIKYALPDVNQSLLSISDSNTYNATWKHTSDDAVTKVTFTYKRDILTPNISEGDPVLDRMTTIDVIHEFISGSATLLDGEVTYEPVTVRSITNSSDGAPYTGDISDETGTQLARLRGHELIDRFRFGGQRITASCNRGDAGIAAAKVGDWAVVSISWLPDYATFKRGSNILAQIVRVKNTNAITRDFELITAGPMDQPITQPSAFALSLNAGMVRANVTALPVGGEVRMDYAISATQPTDSSGLWVFAGRRGTIGYINTPLVPSNCTVWARVRTEAIGRRPSGWVSLGSVVVPINPTPYGGNIAIGSIGKPVVTWLALAEMLGARLTWYIHDIDDDMGVAAGTIDVAASVGEDGYEINTVVPAGKAVTVEIGGWSGFAAGAVGGTQGGSIVMTGKRTDSEYYIKPEVAVTLSEVGATGKVHLDIVSDPHSNFDHVEFATKAGKGAWQSFSVDGAAPYEATVNIVDKHISLIHYRVYGRLEDATIGVIQEDIIPFTVGARPSAPQITYSVSSDGKLRAVIVGDSDAVSCKVLASNTGAPSITQVKAAASRIGRVVVAEDILTLNADEVFWISAICTSDEGLDSNIQTVTDKWLGVGLTPGADPAFSTPLADAYKIVFPFTMDINTSFIEAWVAEYTTDPGTVSSVANIGSRAAGSPIRRGDGRSSFSIPVSTPGNWIVATFVPYDSLNKQGTPVTMKVQSASVVVTPPPAPNPVSNIATGSSPAPYVTNRVTVTQANTKIRTYRNGVQYGADVGPYGSGTRDLTHSSLLPGNTYSWEYSQVVDGIEGAKSSTITTVIPSATYKLNSPVLSESFSDGVGTLTWTTEGNPKDTTYYLYGPGGVVYDTTTSTMSVVSGSSGDQFYVVAKKSGYLDSDPSNTVILGTDE